MKTHFHLVFTEKLGEVDSGEVGCQAWSSKQPKIVQPDLNYVGKWNDNQQFGARKSRPHALQGCQKNFKSRETLKHDLFVCASKAKMPYKKLQQ